MRIDKAKFWFNYPHPNRLTQSRWTQNDKVGHGYFTYKIVLSAFWLCVLCIDLWYNSLRKQGPKYLIYATRWGQIFVTLAVTYDAILVAMRYYEEWKFEKKLMRSQTSFSVSSPGLKIGWFLSTCSYSCAFFVTAIYWAFLFDYSKGTQGVAAMSIFLNIAAHALQSVTAVIDTWMSSRPCRMHHVWCPLLFGIVYMTFNLLYIVAFDGTDPKGNDYVYSILKWNESPGLSLAFVGGAAVALPLFHGVQYGLTILRDRVWSRKYFDPEHELLDGPANSMSTEKETGIRNMSFKKTEV